MVWDDTLYWRQNRHAFVLDSSGATWYDAWKDVYKPACKRCGVSEDRAIHDTQLTGRDMP